MIQHFKVKFTRQSFLKRQQPIIQDLVDRTAVHADQMVMMMIGTVIPQIITGYAVSKIHLLHNMQFTKKLEGSVDGCKAYLGCFILYQHKDIFRAQVVFFVLQQHTYSCLSLRSQLIPL